MFSFRGVDFESHLYIKSTYYGHFIQYLGFLETK